MCVNALNGLFLFLRNSREAPCSLAFWCQRPKRAFLISTSLGFSTLENMIECVNALNGLFLFLRPASKSKDE